jgi:hypothetical protein
MRLSLFLTTFVGLAGASHISSAADATWVAVAETTQGSCIGAPLYWQVDIKGNALTFTARSHTKRSFTVDLKALQPDGSGRLAGKDEKDRRFYVTLDPGSGARPFHLAQSDTPCLFVFTPKA